MHSSPEERTAPIENKRIGVVFCGRQGGDFARTLHVSQRPEVLRHLAVTTSSVASWTCCRGLSQYTYCFGLLLFVRPPNFGNKVLGFVGGTHGFYEKQAGDCHTQQS